jgi:hypothetical protein
MLGIPCPLPRADERHLRAGIGLVPDESLLFDHLTGLEFVESRRAHVQAAPGALAPRPGANC